MVKFGVDISKNFKPKQKVKVEAQIEKMFWNINKKNLKNSLEKMFC